MENYNVYADIIEEGQLSGDKLKEYLRSYSENVEEVSRRLLSQGELEGDELADEFFNTVDEEYILEFKNGEKSYHLYLSRCHDSPDEVEEHQFGAGYLIEVRTEKYGLEDGIDFNLGEEEELIEKLQELGFKRSRWKFIRFFFCVSVINC